MNDKQLNDAMQELIDICFTLFNDWTYKSIAEQSGLSAPTISRLWNDKSQFPRFQTVMKLCRAAGLQVSIKRVSRVVWETIETKSKIRLHRQAG